MPKMANRPACRTGRNVLQIHEIQWLRYREDPPPGYRADRKVGAVGNGGLGVVLQGADFFT